MHFCQDPDVLHHENRSKHRPQRVSESWSKGWDRATRVDTWAIPQGIVTAEWHRWGKWESLQVSGNLIWYLGSLSVSVTWKGMTRKGWDGLSRSDSSRKASTPSPSPGSPTVGGGPWLHSGPRQRTWTCSPPSPASTPTLCVSDSSTVTCPVTAGSCLWQAWANEKEGT